MDTHPDGCLAQLPEELREALRNARLAKRLGFRRLSSLTGVDKSHLSRIERGLRRPSIEVAGLLAQALGLNAADTAWLLSEGAAAGRSKPRPDARSVT